MQNEKLIAHTYKELVEAKEEIKRLLKEVQDYKESLMIRHDDAVRMRRERDILERVLRDMCVGHNDDCGCPGCRSVFRQ